MANENINRTLSEFGSKMKIIALLTILCLILWIVAWVALVTRFPYAGIPYGFAYLAVYFVIFILFFLNLKKFKELGIELNNQDLLTYRSRLIYAFILRLIGLSCLLIAFTSAIVLLTSENFIVRQIPFVFDIIGIIFIITAAIFRIFAWHRLETFLESNLESKAFLCKLAAIFEATVLFYFIGEIIRIIGYFKLSSLKELT